MSPLPESLRIIGSIPELIQWRKKIESKSKQTIGFVPTMGALHEGHAMLLRKVRPKCDISVLSIYVNPAQFGPKEDLSKYPRTFESDLRIAAQEGVDIVFAPTSDEMYPPGYSTYVEETELSRPLCGIYRPVHFQGVTTVVLKLFNLLRPQVALFGLKDAQQFFVVKKMVQDLHLDVRVEGVPTVREADGLALSSRNAYLNAEERRNAPLLYRELSLIRDGLTQSASRKEMNHCTPLGGTPLGSSTPLSNLLTASKERLEKAGFQVQYLECLTLPNLTAPQEYLPGKHYLIAIAAYLGTTRLIDNVMISPELP